MGPVEQIALTVNIALRRDGVTLDYYRTGSQPDGFQGRDARPVRSFQDSAALTHAARQLERATDENASLRKSLEDVSPALAALGKPIPRSRPSRCRPRPRCATTKALMAPTTPPSKR
jgi:hypothetical protein